MITKKLIIVLATIFSTSAFSQEVLTHFKCQTSRNLTREGRHTVEFNILDLDTNQVRLSEEIVPSSTPEGSPLVAIGENSEVRTDGDSLILHGDSDGFFLIDLVLSKKTQYQRGTVRIRDTGEGFGNKRSAVTCVLSRP